MQNVSVFVTANLLAFTLSCEPSAEKGTLMPPDDAKSRPAAKLPDLKPGVHQQTVKFDSVTVRCTISIPKDGAKKDPVPLVVALHYGGEVTPYYGRGMIDSLVGPAFAELGAIIIAPDSLGGDWTEEKNEAAVLSLIDSALASYNVDAKKVLLTGFSMGGIGTWHIAGRHQDRFCAAIPIAGRPPKEEIKWEIPVYVIHSRADTVLPLEPTQQYVDAAKAKGAKIELVVLDGITHYQTGRFAKALKDAVPWIKKVWKK
jgi:predicted peptidase